MGRDAPDLRHAAPPIRSHDGEVPGLPHPRRAHRQAGRRLRDRLLADRLDALGVRGPCEAGAHHGRHGR